MAVGDQLWHVTEEERQQKRPDVRSVDIGVGHYHHAVVSEPIRVVILAKTCPERCDQCRDLLVGEHPVRPGLFDIQDLSPQWQNRLEPSVAALLGGAAGRLALHDEEFALRWIFLGTVGELAGQRAAIHGGLADDQVAGLARRFPGARCGQRLIENLSGVDGVVFEVLREHPA